MTSRAVQLDNEYRKRSRTIGVQNMSRVAEKKNKEEIDLDAEDFDRAVGLDEEKKQEVNDLLAEVNGNLFSKEEEPEKETEETTQFEKLTEEEKLDSEKKWC